MNLYFLVEGRRTEKKIYPKWISHLIPQITKVDFFQDVIQNNYKIFSGFGFPHLLHKHLRASVEEVNESNLYNYFVICLDADEATVEERINEVISFMQNENIILNENVNFKIIVQNKSIESWLLGNSKIYKKNPTTSSIRKLISYYDVSKNDPELMEKMDKFEGSIGDFHFHFLKEYLAERNIIYTKEHPRQVTEKYYLRELIKRTHKTLHLRSFVTFIDFCESIKNEIDN